MKSLYLTTTLPYVNADPHIGFALEIVQADIIARYRTLMGDDVFFNTGTDEHGQKIYEAAQKAGRTPQEYVDEYAAKFRGLKDKLNLHADLHFIRTTDPQHVSAAQEIWRRCFAKGDIEKRTYKGLYCVGDEAFMKESDLVDGKCPNHPNMDLIELEEENYFFKLSRYASDLLNYLKQPGVIVPEWRRLEAIKFVENGLEDFSISRVKEKMPWGIPVPDDDSQVMYVWFDALTNYISTLGWPEDAEGLFEKFWTNSDVMQVAGKDQVRFQSIMWQAMLMSVDIKNTDSVLYHGFITSGGQKMSKSLGNVIDPMTIVDEYGVDALRYFLARHISPFEDSDFTMERFKESYNADLVNGLGNLVSRVMKMAESLFAEPVVVNRNLKLKYPLLEKALDTYDFRTAVEIVWIHIENLSEAVLYDGNEASHGTVVVSGVTSSVFAMNEALTKEAPFKLADSDPKKKELISRYVKEILLIAKMLEPIIPTTSQRIMEAVYTNKKPENLFPRKE